MDTKAVEGSSTSATVEAIDLSVSAITLADENGTVDKPAASLAVGLVESEVSETEIKKVLVNPDTPYTSAKRFQDLNLSPEILSGLFDEMKFERPSKIQAETLPLILTPPYADLVAQAHNGSGKTTCFALGMLSRVDPSLKEPQALCMCPTRELAVQNERVFLKMAKFTGVSCLSTAQADSASSTLRGKISDQVVIGTPGTIKRWISKDRILNLKHMKILVFDEADQMFEFDGFRDDSVRIMGYVKKANASCQTLLFSATFSDEVTKFTSKNIARANLILVPREKLSLDVIRQFQVKCPNKKDKLEVLRDRILQTADKIGQSIVFVRTRESAKDVHRFMEQLGQRCTSIHGGMSHDERDRVIDEFRNLRTNILIATDVLARGFDQAAVTLVVNFDVPVKQNNPMEPAYETYLHRIGRSGRFGRKGVAFNLLHGARDDVLIGKIEQHFDKKIEEVAYDRDDLFEHVLREAGLVEAKDE